MKKILSLSFLAIGVASFACATTITTTCPAAGGFGASGSSTTTCIAAAGPVGATSLNSITLTFKFDANFGLGAGSVLENFDTLPAGPDIFGTLFDHPSNQLVTDAARGIVGSFVILNPTAAQVAASLGGLQIQSNWNSGTGSFSAAALDYQIDVVYSQRDSGVPEPATLGLVGSALAGLGFLARRKKVSFRA
jgi:hypothetical protein